MRGRFPFGYIFLAGLVAGIITMNFGKGIMLEDAGLLNEDMLRQLSNVNLSGSALFAFLLRKRMILFAVFAIAATTYLGMAASVFGAGWYGFCAGVFLTASVLRYGMRGVFFALAATMPQYLIYAPVIYGLFLWCEKTYKLIYGRTFYPEKDKRTPVLTGQVFSLLILAAMMFVGCAMESFVNPPILKGFLLIL